MKSEKLDLLATSLAKAQSEMPAIPMSAENPFLKSKYADLSTMIKVATPVLVKNGLSISQQPVTTDGRIGVTTTLLHTSGQWIEDTITLPLGDERGKSLAQVAGSIITYLRRYSYGAIVGLATDEDTDGNHPAKTEYKTPEPKPAVKDEKPATSYHAGDTLTLEQAENELNSKGVRYGDLETNQLNFMHKALVSKEPKTDEHYRKISAIELITRTRVAA